MPLTSGQKTTLKAAIVADATLNAIPNTADGAFEVANQLDQLATPDYWVWRSAVSEAEIVSQASIDGTIWSWTAYIARSEPERDAWKRMFNSVYSCNPSLANVRQAFADIFSGNTNNAPTQRTHLLAVGRRKATRVEKILASGSGTTASPSLMGFEGKLSYQDVLDARSG